MRTKLADSRGKRTISSFETFFGRGSASRMSWTRATNGGLQSRTKPTLVSSRNRRNALEGSRILPDSVAGNGDPQDEDEGELPEEDDDNPFQQSDEALPDDEKSAPCRAIPPGKAAGSTTFRGGNRSAACRIRRYSCGLRKSKAARTEMHAIVRGGFLTPSCSERHHRLWRSRLRGRRPRLVATCTGLRRWVFLDLGSLIWRLAVHSVCLGHCRVR